MSAQVACQLITGGTLSAPERGAVLRHFAWPSGHTFQQLHEVKRPEISEVFQLRGVLEDKADLIVPSILPTQIATGSLYQVHEFLATISELVHRGRV